jgi:hypothetical protein
MRADAVINEQAKALGAASNDAALHESASGQSTELPWDSEMT